MRQHFVLLFVLVPILVSAPGAAQQCRYEFGQWGYGPTTAVEVRSDLGLVASGAVLQVVDVSQPVMIDVLAELNLPGVIEAMVHTDNGLAVVAVGRHGLFLVDLSDPTKPVASRVRLDDSPTPVTVVATSGNLAFAVEQPLGILDDEFLLSIIDISDPADPEIVGSMMEEGTVEDLAAAGETVYLALTGAVLLEVDVSTPQQPSFGTFIPDTYGLRTPVRVEICDDVVYFSQHNATFEGRSTIHAVAPGSLTELWSEGWWLTGVNDLECDGNNLMVEDAFGMTLIDVSESSPTKIGSYGHSSGYGHVDLEPAAGVTFTADPYGGLRTIDVAEPDETTEIGIADVNGWYPMRHMARVGRFLVGVSPPDGLTVIDVADPIRPTLVSSNPTLGLGSWVAGSNHHVFVAAGDQGVEVIDISQPASPILVGTIETNGDAFGLVVSGSHLFVSSDSLEIFDISDPIHPIPVADLDATGTPQLEGNRLLLGAVDGLRIIDVSDPSAPLLLGWLETDWLNPDSQVVTIASTADRAYLSTFAGSPWNSGLHVVDIADPASPLLLASIDSSYPIVGLAVKDDILLAGVAYEGRILSFDVSNPHLPRQIAALDLYAIGDDHSFTPAVRMDIHGFLESGPIAYAGLMDFGYPSENPAMRVIDISDPTQPRLAGTIPGLPETTGVALGDGIAVTTESGKGIRVFDLSEPRAPRELASYPIPRIRDQIAIPGDVAYLAAGGEGLQLIDLADPAAPQLIETVETSTWALDVQDDLLFASVTRGNYPNHTPSLQIFGLAEPRSPVELGSCDLDRPFGMVAVAGSTAVGAVNIGYTSMPETRISIIDVSDPASPEIVGVRTLHGSPTAVEVAGHHVYLTISHWQDPDQHGLHIMDISDPAHPVDIATILTPGDAIEVALAGNLAYVSDTKDGVSVYDITNPAAPVEVRRFATPGDARAIAMGDQPSLVAVIADGAGGLTTINSTVCLANDPDAVHFVDD